ncbi:hypothetical protein PR048_029287 [Dryococelus australis]|uniref:Uncharacterized protein n=1 Tax=Dryococelus australis TaxID=614101 RepID=A0ABQ9GFH0_9NEOP|nr:hypothetical protein PR048_029287 [Dryococelus australis]
MDRPKRRRCRPRSFSFHVTPQEKCAPDTKHPGMTCLLYPPPTEVNRVQSPAGSLPNFASGKRAGICPSSAGFLGDLPFPRPCIPALLHSHLISPSSAEALHQGNGARMLGYKPGFEPRNENKTLIGHGWNLVATLGRLIRGRGGVVVRLVASHLGEPGYIPGVFDPGSSRVGIAPDDATGRWVFSGISRFSRPSIPALLHTHLTLPSSAVKTSMFRAAEISPLHSKDNRSTAVTLM